MSRVYWDTMLFAYILEGNPVFGKQTREAYQALFSRGDTICTSVFTLGEILVRPRMVKDEKAYQAIRSFMRGGDIELVPFTAETAEEYSTVRAQTRLKAADAIHVASAIQSKADLFVTNDLEIRKKRIPGLPFIAGLDGKIF
ncbi:MAG: type II toxin-antitoxin system VapC family toxin [Terracidiphilus sp.]